jgi:glucose/arabinose dehydrogenase
MKLALLTSLTLTAVAAMVACSSEEKITPLPTTSTSSSSTGGGMGGASSSSSSSSSGTGGHGGHITHDFCKLPGSIKYENGTATKVPGGQGNDPDLSYLKLPDGMCAHFYANIGNARQMRFAPGGELFLASPTTGTTGGGQGGKSAILVVPDDNNDGYGDSALTFLDNLPSTQGLLFANDHFYYQDHTKILRIPYKAGDRKPQSGVEQVIDITSYQSSLHWPKALDIADDGTIFVANGGDEGEACDTTHPFHGGIWQVDGTVSGKPVVKGCRNPIAVRCSRGHNKCFALELAKDYTGNEGGREKMIPIRAGDDWGFPCCASKNLPYPNVMPVPDCSQVTQDTDGFTIGDTPFGVDIEPGLWPAPFTGNAFVANHGAFGSWVGARVVMIDVDPATGIPYPADNLNGQDSKHLHTFAAGWDDNSLSHGRPAAVTFAPDGRMFLTNDNNGDIIWIAPLSL